MLTWERVGKLINAEANYPGERERLVRQFRIAENEDLMVWQGTVRAGMCDMRVEMIEDILNSEVLMELFQKFAKDESLCEVPTHKFANMYLREIEKQCFSECSKVLHDFWNLIDDDLICEGGANMTVFYRRVAKREECALPTDTLLLLVEQVWKERCHKWHPPSVFWVYNDKGATAKATHEQACKMHPLDVGSQKNHEEMLVQGMCPEGTSCKCPGTWFREPLETSKIRAARVYFTGGFASSSPFFFGDMMQKLWVDVIRDPLARAWLSDFQLVPSFYWFLVSPPYLLITALDTGKVLSSAYNKWSCSDSVGCWPEHPVRVKRGGIRGKCRIPEPSPKGRSPLWFMPPPMLKATKKGFFLRSCTLRSCSPAEQRIQKVGFGGSSSRDVFNCQPLIYADMTADQKKLYLLDLHETGVGDEYDLPVLK